MQLGGWDIWHALLGTKARPAFCFLPLHCKLRITGIFVHLKQFNSYEKCTYCPVSESRFSRRTESSLGLGRNRCIPCCFLLGRIDIPHKSKLKMFQKQHQRDSRWSDRNTSGLDRLTHHRRGCRLSGYNSEERKTKQ